MLGHARRRGAGLLPVRREPGRRLGATRSSTGSRWRSSTGWSCATSRRSRAPRSGTTRPRSRPASCAPRRSAPRSSSCRPPRTPRRTARFTNTQRLLQWHHKAVEPKGDCRSELWFIYHLGRRIREKLGARATTRRTARCSTCAGTTRPRARSRSRAPTRCCGRSAAGTPTGKPVSGYTELKADGSTVCGCWIYCGCYADGVNQTARRKPGSEQSWVAPEWGWAWPVNRRILYNRASADPGRQAVVRAQALRLVGRRAGQVDGRGRARLQGRHAARLRAARGREGGGRAARRRAVHHAGRRARLAVRARAGSTDGPLPTHYEPHESPFGNPLYGQQANPARERFPRPENPYNPSDGEPRRGRLPVRDDDLPADRAPHRRRHVAHAPLPLRAPAGDVLRGQPGAGARARARRTAAGRRSSARAPRSRRA